jgi:hypothetical protein
MEECDLSHSGDRKTFPAFGNEKVSFQGPEEFSDMGECEKDRWVTGKMSRYQQRDCLSLVLGFSDGKLKQKGVFDEKICQSAALVWFGWQDVEFFKHSTHEPSSKEKLLTLPHFWRPVWQKRLRFVPIQPICQRSRTIKGIFV